MPKKKNARNSNVTDKSKRTLELADENQQYGKILKLLGDRRLTLLLPDQSTIMAHIPGRYRKRLWMGKDDVVLVSRRSFQDDKCDVLHKFEPNEVSSLIRMGELPEDFKTMDADNSARNMIFGDDDLSDDGVSFDFNSI